MTEPIRPEHELRGEPLEKKTRAAERVEATWLTDPYADDRYLIPEEEVAPHVYKKERLFPRKVLVGWALAALTFWFIISFVAPIVASTIGETVRETVIGGLNDRGVKVNVNGHPVARSIPPIQPIPAVPAIPPLPAVPGVAGVSADRTPHAVPAPASGARTTTKPAPEPKTRR